MSPRSREVNEEADLLTVLCRSSPLLFVYTKDSFHRQSAEPFLEYQIENKWKFNVSTTTDVSHIESAVVTCDSLPPDIGNLLVLGIWLSRPRRRCPDSTLPGWPQVHFFSQCGIVRRPGPYCVPPRRLPDGARKVTGSSTVGPTEIIACYLQEPSKA